MHYNYLKQKNNSDPWQNGTYWPPIDSMYDFGKFVRTGQKNPLKPGASFASGTAKNELPIVIIGGGLAGLLTAYETARSLRVSQSAKRIYLLEATDRFGGRIRSSHWSGIDDALIELGAMRFPQTPLFTYYADLANMANDTANFPDPGKTPLTQLIYRGQRLSWMQGELPPGLFKSLNDKWASIVDQITSTLSNRKDGYFARRNWQGIINRFWNKSFYEFLIKGGFTAEELVPFGALGIGSGGFGNLYPISALDMIRLIANGLEYDQQLYKKGISQLTDYLYKECQKLDVRMLKNSVVTSITIPEYKDETKVHFNDSNNNHIYIVASSVVVAMGNRAMHTIGIDKLFNSTSMTHYTDDAIRNLHNVSSTKIGCWTDSKFYKNSTYIPQNIQTDSFIRGLYCLDYTPEEHSGHGMVFLSYTWDDASVQLQGVMNEPSNPPSKSLIDLLLAQIKINSPEFYTPFIHSIGGEGSVDYERFQYIQWQEEPYYYGGFKLFYPGQDKEGHDCYFDFQKENGNPAPSVFLAGDAMSFSGGWATSAIETAVNATCGVLKREGLEVRSESPLNMKSLYNFWPKRRDYTP